MIGRINFEVVPLLFKIVLERILENGLSLYLRLYGRTIFLRILYLVRGRGVSGTSPDISIVGISELWGSLCLLLCLIGPSGIKRNRKFLRQLWKSWWQGEDRLVIYRSHI